MKDYKLIYDVFDETYEFVYEAKDDKDAFFTADDYIIDNLTDKEYENLSSVDIYDISEDNYRAIKRGPHVSLYLGYDD